MPSLSSQLRTDAAIAREREVLAAANFLHRQGWTPATSSNFSYRHPERPDVFFISISSKDKGELTEGEFIPVDFQGRPLAETPHKPSAETLLHALVYANLPQTGVVLHTHSVNGTVLSKLFEKQGGLTIGNFEILKGLEGIKTHEAEIFLPVFPNDQDMTRLAARIRDWWQGREMPPYGFLLAGHGLYTWGETSAQARRHVEVFEFLFDCILKLRSHGHTDDSR